MLFNLAFTIGNVPYATLTASLSDRYDDRSRLSGYRLTLGILGGLIGASVAANLLTRWGEGENSFLWVASVFAGIAVTTIWVSFASVKERVKVIKEKVKLSKALKMVQLNRPFISLTLCFFFNFAALYLIMAMIPYYFEYYLGRKDLQEVGLAVIYLSSAGSIPGWVWISRRVGKHNVYLFGGVLYIAGLVGLYLSPSDNLSLQFLFMVLTALGTGSSAFAGWAMLGDTIEFGEWKTGIRVEALIFGIYGFFFKLGSGLGQALAGWGLDVFDYKYPVVELNGTVIPQDQSALTMEGISMVLTLVPSAMILASMMALTFYEISPKQHQRLLNSLGRGEDA
jgi:GPH family glycoside/pentoside/hexuronide:cation symporter